jgi:hypothetical protein
MIPTPEIWRIRDALNTEHFMRMKDGHPEARIYDVIDSEGRVVAEMWLPVADRSDETLDRIRRNAALVSYTPLLFWMIRQFNETDKTPEAIRELADIALKAIDHAAPAVKPIEPGEEAQP